MLICPTHGRQLVRRNGRYGPFWGCPVYPFCTVIARRSQHDQQIRISTQPMRDARIRAHETLDVLWQDNGPMSRGDVYRWLQDVLDMIPKQCHLEHFDIDTCDRIVALVKVKLKELQR